MPGLLTCVTHCTLMQCVTARALLCMVAMRAFPLHTTGCQTQAAKQDIMPHAPMEASSHVQKGACLLLTYVQLLLSVCKSFGARGRSDTATVADTGSGISCLPCSSHLHTLSCIGQRVSHHTTDICSNSSGQTVHPNNLHISAFHARHL